MNQVMEKKKRGRPLGSKNKNISVMKTKNSLHQNKHVKGSMFVNEHLQDGLIKEQLNLQEQKEVINDTFVEKLFQNQEHLLLEKPVDTSATLEYHQLRKKKIWKDKLSTLEINTLNMKLSETLEAVSTLKEKVLTPFWTQQSKEMSEKLWLPTKIDYVDSVLNSLKESSLHTPKGKSWFSINKKHPLKKNSLMTSFQSSMFSHPESMDLEAIKLKNKSKKIQTKKEEKLKTIKLRMFPTKEEEEKLLLALDQSRWYYNATVDIVSKRYETATTKLTDEKQYSFQSLRNMIRKYDFEEENINDTIIKSFHYNENKNNFPIPDWWNTKELKPHNRLITGSIKKFTQNLNSALSNKQNGHIKDFKLKFISNKKDNQFILYETEDYPVFINKIKTNYWYRTHDHKRKNISYMDIKNQTKGRMVEIIYDKLRNRFTLNFPVSANWYPEDDNRNENQVRFEYKGDRVIALDPGVRKFLVGYDPTGEMIFIGEGANKDLLCMMKQIDLTTNKKDKLILWKKVKNYVSELHWKAISFLIENYDLIILPEFPVQKMIKGHKLKRSTKRCMMMFSYFQFKEKLKWKCSLYNKQLMIVDESYTSKTCGTCGCLTNVQGSELYVCSHCKCELDRDCNGARNIFIKNSIPYARGKTNVS